MLRSPVRASSTRTWEVFMIRLMQSKTEQVERAVEVCMYRLLRSQTRNYKPPPTFLLFHSCKQVQSRSCRITIFRYSVVLEAYFRVRSKTSNKSLFLLSLNSCWRCCSRTVSLHFNIVIMLCLLCRMSTNVQFSESIVTDPSCKISTWWFVIHNIILLLSLYYAMQTSNFRIRLGSASLSW